MYSLKLVATDRVPKGKRNCASLREKEAEIRKDLEGGKKPRAALTEEQEEKLLSFIKNDRAYRKYYDVVVLFLKTGLRISELCGHAYPCRPSATTE